MKTHISIPLEVLTEQVGQQLGALDLLWIENESLSVSKTREGFGWDCLHLQQIIFQVERSQGGIGILWVAHSPLFHHPASRASENISKKKQLFLPTF